MPTRFTSFFLVLFLFVPVVSAEREEDKELPLLTQAKEAAAKRYEYAVEKGAKVLRTADGRSFYVLWQPPEESDEDPSRFIVTLHGHESWAFDEFYLWHPFAEEHGIGILALQWWFGEGEGSRDYYAPSMMYPVIELALRKRGVQTGDAILHGFSRGSANVYALAVLDRQAKNNFFGLIIANAGGASEDYPPNVKITEGFFGPAPFEGTDWILFCAGLDTNPERDGCPSMDRTRRWIADRGGRIQLFIEDPMAEHGGFQQSPRHVDVALEVFHRLKS